MMMVFFFFLGGCLASFSLWLAQTYVNDTSYFRTRSCCPQCGKALCPYDMIPVFSYLFLKGKCRRCGAPIPLIYLATEVLFGLFSMAIYFLFGMHSQTILLLALLLLLFTISLVDYYITILPDCMLLPSFLVFPPLFIYCGLITAADALSGFLAAFICSAGLRAVFYLLRKKEGLGLGDVKLFALAGALCGRQFLPLLFFLSASLALLVLAGLYATGRVEGHTLRHYRLPFGPFIAASLFIVILLHRIGAYSLFLF